MNTPMHRMPAALMALRAAQMQKSTAMPGGATPAPGQGQHGGNTYQVGARRDAPSAGSKGGGLKSRRSKGGGGRRAVRGAASIDTDDDPGTRPGLAESPEDEGRGVKAIAGASLGGESGQRDNPQRDGDQRREQRQRLSGAAAATAQFRHAPSDARQHADDLPQRLMSAGIPGSRVLFGGPADGGAAMPARQAMAMVTLGLVLQAATTASPLPLGRAALTATQAQLRLDRGQAAGHLRLDSVMAELTLLCEQAWGVQRPGQGASEAVGNALALLPLRVLNTGRPRTPRQHQQALDRLGLILQRVRST